MTTKSAFTSVLAWTAIMLNLSACNGQTGNQHAPLPTDKLAQRIDTPQVAVRVNKQYDANGNLVAFDSTYTSIYRSQSGNAAFMDSVFKDFKPRVGTHYPFLNDPGFNDLFFNDSLFHHDFFHDDFFQKRMEMNERFMHRMMVELDSMKNTYLQSEAGKREPAQ